MAIDFRGLTGPGFDATEVLKSYGIGRQMARQDGGDNALRQLVANPDSQQALLGYAQFEPEKAYSLQQDQRTQQRKQQLERDADVAKAAAQLAGTVQNEAEWEQAVDYYAANGYPEAARYKGQFGNRAAIMAQGGYKPQQEPVSALERDYNFVESKRPGAGMQIIENRLDPLVQVTEYDQGQNAYVLKMVPRSQLSGGGQPQGVQQGPQPGMVEDGYKFRGGNPADPNNWEPVGGASPQGSRPFP